MRERWTRRRLLTAAAGTAAVAAAGKGLAARVDASAAMPSAVRAALRAAMDAIVPSEDGMPSASEAGVAAYLEGVAAKEPEVRKSLRGAARALDRAAGKKVFAALDAPSRGRALAALEKKDASTFDGLRDLVYEGYYTRPDVWRRLGYTFYGPGDAGPGAGTFDEALLERVRARAPFWRKAT